jgi:ADP-ribose pyrophosphatase YjhB (NUDIX family)/GT2 family glycosyltransferase
MQIKPIISVVIGSYNRKPFLNKTIRTIRENRITVPYEIIVIDGGSSDGSIDYLTVQKDIITIVQHNSGYWNKQKIDKKNWGYYMNIAFRACHGKYIVMISDDCLVVPDSIMNGFKLFEEELASGRNIAGVAFYWRNVPYEKMYYVRQTLGHKLSINHGMYLKSALEDIGYCEEDKYPFYYGDGNLSLKLWNAGYTIIDCKTAFVEHFHFATMSIRQKNSQNKEIHKRVYLDSWKDTYYDEDIDNQSGKIFLNYFDPHDTLRYFKRTLKYYIGIIQSKFGSFYGYERKRPNRLPSIEMLANPLNIQYLLSKFDISPEQLCIFAFIRKDDKILLGLREYIKNKPVWTYPGGRGQLNETLIDTLKREISEEIGISDIYPIRVIGQKNGVKERDHVYFIECQTSSEPRLMEPEKFKEWKWFPITQLPQNLIDEDDVVFLRKLK